KLEPKIPEWESRKWFPNSVFKDLGELGITGIIIPPEFGGLGLTKLESLKWCEVFGEATSLGLTVGTCMSFLVSANAIMSFGTPQQKSFFLPKIASGELIFAYAFTEPSAGSDLRAISTRAELLNDCFFLNGEKTFITNGARADYFLVFARYGSDYNVFIAHRDQAQIVSKIDKLGWLCSDTAILNFRNSKCEMLGSKSGEGWHQVAVSLAYERLVLSALGIGLVRSGVEETVRFAETRKFKNRSLSSIPLFKNFVSSVRSKISLFSTLISIASSRDDLVFSSALKAYVCDFLMQIADQLLQFHGGYGYTTDYKIERIWRDLRLLPIGGGAREPLYHYTFRKIQKRHLENIVLPK
ncbi:MAG: acyl-CoA/acyl-ACP dehydrogenase, partial [Deltaproteobacteria bacterium]|nr:acyl-CoA/acyl-ACP dehydrogenase [Deltaproteobacteria bacterium]